MWTFPKYKIAEDLDWEDLRSSYSWISDMCGVEQDPDWHGEGDVFIHTKMVVDELLRAKDFALLADQDKHILLTAALLHDVEKRSTTIRELIDGRERIVSPRHAKKGEKNSRQILYKELDAPFQVREQICKLVRLHGLPLWAIEKKDPNKEVVYSSTVVNNFQLSMLTKADVRGRICKDAEELLLQTQFFDDLCIDKDCFERPKVFKSDYGRYLYFSREDSFVDYQPFDDRVCKVTMMCGLPGSGKDTYIKRHLDEPVLSLDDIRRELKVSPTDKKGNGRVIQLAKERAKGFLRTKTSFIFNATNLSRDLRSKWIRLFNDYKAAVKIIYIEVPYKTLLKQNSNRDHVVPKAVLEKLISKLEIPDYREAQEIIYIIDGEPQSLRGD